MIDPQLRDKVVLITGANNPYGIGAAIGNAFAIQGAKVLLSYLRLEPETFGIDQDTAAQATESGMPFYHAQRAKTAESVVEHIKASGGWVRAYEADITDPRQITNLFDWAEESAGSVDVLVNNAAGYHDPDTIFSANLTTYQATFNINVGGTLLMMAEFVRRFQAHGKNQAGRIINLSTDAAQMFPGQIMYGASKATIEAFTRSVAHEVGPLGITVNTIAPGPTQTGYIPKSLETDLLPDIPLGRLGAPQDIADAAIFLASHQARWLTGQVLKVSGGHAL